MPLQAVPRKRIGKGSIVKIGLADLITLAGPDAGGTFEFGRVETFTLPPFVYNTAQADELNPQDDLGSYLRDDPLEITDEVFGNFAMTMYFDAVHDDFETRLLAWYKAQETLWLKFLSGHRNDLTLAPDPDAAVIQFATKLTSITPAQFAKRDFMKITVEGMRRTDWIITSFSGGTFTG